MVGFNMILFFPHKLSEPTEVRTLVLQGLPLWFGDDSPAFFKTCLVSIPRRKCPKDTLSPSIHTLSHIRDLSHTHTHTHCINLNSLKNKFCHSLLTLVVPSSRHNRFFLMKFGNFLTLHWHPTQLHFQGW